MKVGLEETFWDTESNPLLLQAIMSCNPYRKLIYGRAKIHLLFYYISALFTFTKFYYLAVKTLC